MLLLADADTIAMERAENTIVVQPAAIGEVRAAMRAIGVKRANTLVGSRKNQTTIANDGGGERFCQLVLKRDIKPTVLVHTHSLRLGGEAVSHRRAALGNTHSQLVIAPLQNIVGRIQLQAHTSQQGCD